MNRKPFFIRAEWDPEASVWVATSDDVPGLATEEQTLERLDREIKGNDPGTPGSQREKYRRRDAF